MSQVRVLHIITRLIVGGAQENTIFTASLLDRSRWAVDILSGPQTGSEGSLIEEVRGRGIPLYLEPTLVRQVNPLRDLPALVRLARFIRHGRYQIVHTHSSKAGILGRWAARLAGAPIVVHTVHGWGFHDHMSPLARQALIALERWTAPLTDALIVVAESDIEKGLQAGIGRPGQYHLIRSGIPVEAFTPARVDREAVRAGLGLPRQAPVLGTVGRLSAQKNPLDWVRVASLVAQELPDCRFLLVGDGPLRAQMERSLAQQGLSQRTVRTGLRRDVPEMLAAMDVFLMTSLWEGLPRAIPQAMAMHIPVVATNVDGVVEVVRHGQTGYLCAPGDLEGLAAWCLALLRDPALCQAMGGQGGGEGVLEFDLPLMMGHLSDLYENLCVTGRGRPGSVAE
jgi:glycosyltransferase involved in cell wall biosynthesis